MLNGLKQSIFFLVNDCKFSHKDPKVNDSFIGMLHEQYKIIFEDGYGEMQVKRGKFHNYLGMALDYTTGGQVNITMLYCINEVINTFDKVDPTCGSTNSCAEPAVIFKVKEDCEKLNANQAV